MEALKLAARATLAGLLAWPEERVEPIDGEIVRRPMARAEHGLVQSNVVGELTPLLRSADPGGWWFATGISALYEPHRCPSHELAGWRRERLTERPRGAVELPPDWVCEIVSPGQERKDTLTLLWLLQRHRVPFDYLIWSEDRTLVAYALDHGAYRIIANRSVTDEGGPGRVAIPPSTPCPSTSLTSLAAGHAAGRPPSAHLLQAAATGACRPAGRSRPTTTAANGVGGFVAPDLSLSTLQRPHRVFDAVLRDSALDGEPFRDADIGRAIDAAPGPTPPPC